MTDKAEIPTSRPAKRLIQIVERDRIPPFDILFGFGPTVPFVFGMVCAWWFPEPWRARILQMTVLWGSAILLFLSGVRRGLSFRTEGGPTWAQMATMILLFCIGLCSLVFLWIGLLAGSLIGLLAGYSVVVVLDPIAARRGEAPLYFGRLRRFQIPIILLSLAICTLIALRI